MNLRKALSQTFLASARCKAAVAAGDPGKTFDFEKALKLIKKYNAIEASAGLKEDWFSTAATIWEDGKPVEEHHAYLASLWATPILVIDDSEFECWKKGMHSHEWPVHILKEQK
jgi:hypothetical protein